MFLHARTTGTILRQQTPAFSSHKGLQSYLERQRELSKGKVALQEMFLSVRDGQFVLAKVDRQAIGQIRSRIPEDRKYDWEDLTLLISSMHGIRKMMRSRCVFDLLSGCLLGGQTNINDLMRTLLHNASFFFD